jgi:hypothetical protein
MTAGTLKQQDSSRHAEYGQRLFCFCSECKHAIESPSINLIHCTSHGTVRDASIARTCGNFKPCE